MPQSHRLVRRSHGFAPVLGHQAQAGRHYRRASEDLDRLKARRAELRNEPIIDPDLEQTKTTYPYSQTDPSPTENPPPGAWTNGGADPLVRSRPPGRLFEGGNHLILREKSGSRGSAPPFPADSEVLEKYVALGFQPAMPAPLRAFFRAILAPSFSPPDGPWAGACAAAHPSYALIAPQPARAYS